MAEGNERVEKAPISDSRKKVYILDAFKSGTDQASAK